MGNIKCYFYTDLFISVCFQVSYADIVFLNVAPGFGFVGIEDKLNEQPALAALIKRVESLPKIAAWIAKRPKSDF